ncbi:MAG: YebC/PmpR family DNA-binding transcriptional regulator [Chlamydiae bacterium]|nr:YebC/PmpR family DNA-binding transcriptional regulator [Chlamydiota bacterium]MBI3267141.1 YebC/PmpR family DNA-binding transcriptional regulator [Chlamydiota bacterium]
MSGHSKWATIKHKKAATDAKRGQVFSKVVKEITVAARTGGADPNSNPRLRTVLAKAKEVNMPADNIDRAIKKGTGELPGVSYEEQIYEGYGPAGVAVIVEALTDNKNRTAAEIRSLFSKNGGNLGGAGSVAWMFHKKGLISIPKKGVQEDQVFTIATEAGAEDFKVEEESFEVIFSPNQFETVKEALTKNHISMASSEVTLLPQNTIAVGLSEARKVLDFVSGLEDHEDVQNVYANFDIPDDVMAELEKES